MFVRRDQHLIAPFEIQSVGDETHPLGGVSRQRNLVGVCPDEGCGLCTYAFNEFVLFRVVCRGIARKCTIAFDDRGEHGFRGRPQRPVVHVRDIRPPS